MFCINTIVFKTICVLMKWPGYRIATTICIVVWQKIDFIPNVLELERALKGCQGERKVNNCLEKEFAKYDL